MEVPVFPAFDPNAPKLVLGLMIGLMLSVACHYAAWALR